MSERFFLEALSEALDRDGLAPPPVLHLSRSVPAVTTWDALQRGYETINPPNGRLSSEEYKAELQSIAIELINRRVIAGRKVDGTYYVWKIRSDGAGASSSNDDDDGLAALSDDARKTLHRALASIAAAKSDPLAILRAVRGGAAVLAEYDLEPGYDAAIAHLQDVARDHYGLSADDIQAQISGGLRDVLDRRAERGWAGPGIGQGPEGLREGPKPNGSWNEAQSSGWPEPDMRLVDDDRTPPPPFDWNALPPAWRDWVKNTADDCGAPADYIAATLISTASAVIGNARRVSPWGGWVEQPHLWFALIGQPSTNKTVALAPFKTACNAIEKTAEPAHKEALKRYTEKKQAADAARHQWQEAVKLAVKNNEPPPPMPNDAHEPDQPVPPRVMIADASTEEVGKLLAGNHCGLVLVRSELPGWLGQFDRYGGAGADRAFYLETWDGGSHAIDRVKFAGVPLRVPYASLAIVGSIQPDHLRKVFAGINDGLAARFIYVWPSPVPPQRPDRSGAEGRIKILCDAFAKLRRLNWDHNDLGEPVPMILRLEEPALDILDRVRREAFEANQARGAGVMAGWHGKNQGRLLRFALVFELLEWAIAGDTEPMSISKEMTVRAADFLDYATSMMSRVSQDLLVTDADRDAASLARYIKTNSIVVLNEREIYQKQFHPLRDAQHRKQVFFKLEEAGWIRRADAPTGGRPRGDWNVNPRIREH